MTASASCRACVWDSEEDMLRIMRGERDEWDELLL